MVDDGSLSEPLIVQISSILSDRDHRQEIATAINPAELVTLLKLKGLIEESESNQLLKLAPQKSAEIILENVQERGGEALTDFLWCLEQTSDNHLGHRYAMKVLTNTQYDLETLGDITASIVLKKKFQELRTKMVMSEGIDVDAILPHLLQIGLISDIEMNELDLLKLTSTRKKRFIKLKSILANKGPLAHLYFTQALINAKEENPHLHKDIFLCLFGPPDDYGPLNVCLANPRQIDLEDQIVPSLDEEACQDL